MYKSGKLHADADALSRHPVEVAEELNDDPPMPIATLTMEESRAALRAAQETVPEWKLAFEKIKLGTPSYTRFGVKDGVLYAYRPHVRGNEWKLCIPKTFKLEVLRACHDDIISGHLGVTRTLTKVIERYHWKGLIKDVVRYVSACPSCQTRKRPPGKAAGFMEPIRSSNPFERIGIDIFGPFPVSTGGNKNVIVAIDYFF